MQLANAIRMWHCCFVTCKSSLWRIYRNIANLDAGNKYYSHTVILVLQLQVTEIDDLDDLLKIYLMSHWVAVDIPGML